MAYVKFRRGIRRALFPAETRRVQFVAVFPPQMNIPFGVGILQRTPVRCSIPTPNEQTQAEVSAGQGSLKKAGEFVAVFPLQMNIPFGVGITERAFCNEHGHA